jgi:hypothetical protein
MGLIGEKDAPLVAPASTGFAGRAMRRRTPDNDAFFCRCER